MKGQSYTLDFIIAMAIMTITLLTVSSFVFTEQPSRVTQDAKILAAAVTLPYPRYWDDSTVISPGFVVDHRIDRSLLENFTLLSETDVQDLTGIVTQYHVNVSTNTTLLGIAGTPPDADAEEIAVVVRYAADNGSIARIEVIAWE